MQEFNIIKTQSKDITDLRQMFLQENNFQFIHNKCHDYGWADCYVFMMAGERIGYGAVWGINNRKDRDTLFEFYLGEPFRKYSSSLFKELLTVSGVTFIECQTNDFLLSSLFFEFAKNIRAESILFKEHRTTDLVIPGAAIRKRKAGDNLGDDDSDYVMEKDGEIAGSGGLMLNYNFPYADIYMSIKEPFRGAGLGSFLVQELKKEAYRMGRVPAARCNITNAVSRSTLLKAGFRICGCWLQGEVKA